MMKARNRIVQAADLLGSNGIRWNLAGEISMVAVPHAKGREAELREPLKIRNISFFCREDFRKRSQKAKLRR